MTAETTAPDRWQVGGRSDQVGAGSVLSLPTGPVPLRDALADVAARLLWLDGWDSGRAVGDVEGFTRGHRAGFDTGDAHGYARAMAEVEARESAWLDAVNRRTVGTVLARGDYAALCELRGEPGRAARQRAILSGRGVTR